MIHWLKQLRSAFGVAFLWLVCLIYFTQGFRSFVWTAVSYQLKDRLQLSPSASQFVFTVSFFPWSIKPLYGIISDCIPIGGKKRTPYLVISTVLSLVPWVMLGLDSTSRSSSLYLMILLTVQNIGSAMADVVVDAMIAEAVRLEKASFAGDLQSISWFAMAVGGICGSLLGGYALTNLNIETIFLLFTVLPALQLLSCTLVEEIPASNELLDSNGFEEKSYDNYSDTKKSNIKRRKGKKKKSGKGASSYGKSVTQKKQSKSKSLGSQLFQSLRAATFELCRAFKQPMILRPMAWFFIAHITVPNLSTVMFYYQTEVLQLDASFLGTARVVGWSGLMLGTFVYNRYLTNMTLRKSLLFAHIGLSITILLDMVLVSRANVGYRVSDKTMVLFGSALADAINQLKFMPFLILSGRLCPPGIEGTLFALFMSINNLGNTIGSFMGAGLALLLGISSGSFENMFMGLAIQVFCTYIPVLFLFLIPKEATGVSAS
ncbi:unnamed protein product [Microthlaspi erraticum]|uniref:Major facilitator superfamily (MFS) profile domain-containing protein n=1 Tax=Microthlaspi erraticum TaxID=1685480 RepID=A0A6D2I7S4_9BRAS|nr:unnamed protein product [Microthlaspi erraticum]